MRTSMKSSFHSISVFFVLLTFSTYARASTECPGKEGSTVNMSCHILAELKLVERDLDIEYRRQLKNPETQAYLIKAQEAWLQYRTHTCTWEQMEFGGMNSIRAIQCIVRMTLERLAYLKEL